MCSLGKAPSGTQDSDNRVVVQRTCLPELQEPDISIGEVASPASYDPEEPGYVPTPIEELKRQYLPARMTNRAPAAGHTYNYMLGDTRVALLGAPSLYRDSAAAKFVSRVRSTALTSANIRVKIDFPEDCVALRKRESAVLPDGTVYTLTSTWMRDPDLTQRVSTSQQTL